MIRSFQHGGLKRLYERGDRSGVRAVLVDKIDESLRCSMQPPRHRRLLFPGIGCIR
jgi:hypothetical protein